MPNNPAYLKNLLAASVQHRIVTTEPIINDHGIKLVDSGVHLSPDLYDKLVMHKIARPIDDCLALAQPITAATIAADLQALLQQQGHLARLLDDTTRHALAGFASGLPLSALAAFKLTLFKTQLPAVYEHSLQVALLAVLLVRRLSRDTRTGLNAFAAGLFHDLGLLHCDPRLLHSGALFNPRELDQIHAHPITAHLIVDRLPEWPDAVKAAILEHHERLDGSGYPKALDQSQASPLGQVIALADVASAVLDRSDPGNMARRLHIVLRINHGKLNRELAGHLVELSQALKDFAPPARPAELAQALDHMVQMSMHLQEWRAIAGEIGFLTGAELINQRLELLQRNLAALGIDLDYWSMMDAELPEDQAAVGELAVAAEEGLWQIKAIAHEVTRKWEKLFSQHQHAQQRIRTWCHRILHPEGML